MNVDRPRDMSQRWNKCMAFTLLFENLWPVFFSSFKCILWTSLSKKCSSCKYKAKKKMKLLSICSSDHKSVIHFPYLLYIDGMVFSLIYCFVKCYIEASHIQNVDGADGSTCSSLRDIKRTEPRLPKSFSPASIAEVKRTVTHST